MEYTPLMELFNKRKKESNKNKKSLPKKIETKTYEKDQIRKEVEEIQNYAVKILKSDCKEFYNKGLTKTDLADYYKYEDDDINEYKSGKSFPILDYDLWDYPKGNPRLMFQEDGNHPIYDVMKKIKDVMEENIMHKHPNFTISLEGGDWDTGSMSIDLK